MEVLVTSQANLIAAERCDIDFHLPSVRLSKYPQNIVRKVATVSSISRLKRDPRSEPDATFDYIDISAVDTAIGRIVNPQELCGSEAPSRARKIIHTDDIIVSTCRPARGAIAIVPDYLDAQICSTAFTVLKPDTQRVLVTYLHWAMRLPSTLEQFRKRSTGASYPAVLDEDVAETLIPLPAIDVQSKIVELITKGLDERDQQIEHANSRWASIQHEAEAKIVS